jgi:hypothetical protein
MNVAEFKRNEEWSFFNIVGELNQAVRDNQPREVIDYHIEELLGVIVNTKRPALRQRAIQLVHKHGGSLALLSY